jgi:hypothetical protein
VRSASISGVYPICHCRSSGELEIEGYSGSRDDVTVNLKRLNNRYFETLGIAILAGRDFDERDTASSARVAIVNQSMARKYFGDGNALGRYFRIRQGDRFGDPIEIVGIVEDTKYNSTRAGFPLIAYLAWNQDETFAPLTKFELRPWAGAPTALLSGLFGALALLRATL